MSQLRWVITYLSVLRIIPAYLFMKANRFRGKCEMDLEAWVKNTPDLSGIPRFWQFGYLLVTLKECRNIYLNRLHRNPVMYLIVRILFPPLESCYINMPPEKIGGGFSLQHGFATIISAKEIGENCRVFQQVTVGYNGTGAPEIGNDVRIAAGSIVIGGIRVHDGACIGAGAVVIRDVPENTTVVGVPAKPIKRTGDI